MSLIKEAIGKLIKGEDLNLLESTTIMREIMSGEATKAQIASFLIALRMKGETVKEITSFAQTMKEFCIQIHPKVDGRRIIDIVGTGGDAIKSFNVSTASSFVVAGSKSIVAKHGNRSFTGKCGSADVLESLGYNLNIEPKTVEESIEKIGIGFMFAPVFHPAMRHAMEPRRDIGVRTVFNILGPLTNPASPKGILVGVYDESMTKTLGEVLLNLEYDEAMVVHGIDGLDEISTLGKTGICWLKKGALREIEISPKDFGLRISEPEDIIGRNPKENAEILFKILNGYYPRNDPKMEMTLLNAAGGFIVYGSADSFEEALIIARESIESGAAYGKLKELIRISLGDLSKLEELEKRHG